MKTRGGMVSIKSHYNASDAFNLFLNNSHINYFSNGSYGTIFKATLRDGIVSPYESFSPHIGYTDLRTIIFKLVFLSDTKENSYEFDMTEFDRSKFLIHSVTSDSFKKETNIHVDIHAKTYDYGEPLCPSVIFSTILEESGVSKFAEILSNRIRIYDGTGLTLETILIFPQIVHFVERKQINKMGIIVMEFAENYSMLYDILNDEIKQHCINMSLYLLIELYKLGYIHGDHHPGNILINISYENYFYGLSGRPLIIDFGRTQLLTEVFSHAKISELKKLYQDGRYTELLIQLNNRYDLTRKNNKKKYGYASGVYDVIGKRDQLGFPQDTNAKIGSMLTLHEKTREELEKQGDIVSEQRAKATSEEDQENLKRVPIYPLADSDPESRRIVTYRTHLGKGVIKKSRRKNKKKRKGKTYNNRKRTIKIKNNM